MSVEKKVTGYSVTVAYSAPFAYTETLEEAKVEAKRAKEIYPGSSIYLGAIWRLYSDDTRVLAVKGGR